MYAGDGDDGRPSVGVRSNSGSRLPVPSEGVDNTTTSVASAIGSEDLEAHGEPIHASFGSARVIDDGYSPPDSPERAPSRNSAFIVSMHPSFDDEDDDADLDDHRHHHHHIHTHHRRPSASMTPISMIDQHHVVSFDLPSSSSTRSSIDASTHLHPTLGDSVIDAARTSSDHGSPSIMTMIDPPHHHHHHDEIRSTPMLRSVCRAPVSSRRATLEIGVVLLISTVLAISIVGTMFVVEPDAIHKPRFEKPSSPVWDNYTIPAERLLNASRLAKHAAYQRLTTFTDRYPARLSGSRNLENAIDWVLAELRRDDLLRNVRAQDVMVPHWRRNQESLRMLEPFDTSIPMLALGGSIATPPEGIEAEIVVVSSFDELNVLDRELVEGKIVLYNVPFIDPLFSNDTDMFHHYSRVAKYRVNGAIEAAKRGAVASLVRSLTPMSLRTVHTGVMYYDNAVSKIPAAAIAVEDAEFIQRAYSQGTRVRVRLTMACETLDDAPSRNVIAEIVGREKPHEIIVIGGHIDSWDVGTGAVDDGGGILACWQAMNVIASLIRNQTHGIAAPRRTIRLVMWVNEENGIRGALTYRGSLSESELANHLVAIESDAGVFMPESYSFSGTSTQYQFVYNVSEIIEDLTDRELNITSGVGGSDVSPLDQAGIPTLGLLTESSKYFLYHHSEGDTIDKVSEKELGECIATLAIMAYLAADFPDPLGVPLAGGS